MKKSFQSIVKLEFAYNNFEADSIEEYIDCVKTQFSEEYNIERKFRETRLYQIAPVSTNMILAYVAHKVLGFPRSY